MRALFPTQGGPRPDSTAQARRGEMLTPNLTRPPGPRGLPVNKAGARRVLFLHRLLIRGQAGVEVLGRLLSSGLGDSFGKMKVGARNRSAWRPTWGGTVAHPEGSRHWAQTLIILRSFILAESFLPRSA